MNDHKKTMWRDNKRRKELSEILPLETPLALNVEVSSGCNLKCCYCLQSLDMEQKKKQQFIPQMMELEIFKKIVDDCKGFRDKLQVLRISGLGEPLLNPDIADMIGYANLSGCFEKIMIFTNGCLLTPVLSDAIIQAGGVDSILFDIQGLNNDDYKKNSMTEIDFEQLINNIRYFYNKTDRKKTEVFVKIYRFAVEGREEQFFERFSSISDYVSIDNIYEAFKNIDYTSLITTKDVLGNDINYERSLYCPYPFFQMTIDSNGIVEACCNTQERSDNTLFIGDIQYDPLKEVWEGEKLCQLRKHIIECGNDYKVCAGCKMLEHLPITDKLDGDIKKLKSIYEGELGE